LLDTDTSGVGSSLTVTSPIKKMSQNMRKRLKKKLQTADKKKMKDKSAPKDIQHIDDVGINPIQYTFA